MKHENGLDFMVAACEHTECGANFNRECHISVKTIGEIKKLSTTLFSPSSASRFFKIKMETNHVQFLSKSFQ